MFPFYKALLKEFQQSICFSDDHMCVFLHPFLKLSRRYRFHTVVVISVSDDPYPSSSKIVS